MCIVLVLLQPKIDQCIYGIPLFFIFDYLLDFISSSLEKGYTVDVILLYFANAFDTIPLKRLLLKLRKSILWNLCFKS